MQGVGGHHSWPQWKSSNYLCIGAKSIYHKQVEVLALVQGM